MAATPWESDLARELKERFGDGITETSTYLGQNFIVAKPGAAIPLLEYLKLEVGFRLPRGHHRGGLAQARRSLRRRLHPL